jgi:hypothetical protein
MIGRNVARWRMARWLGSIVFLGLGLLLHAAEWHSGVIPDTVGANYSTLKLDRQGNVHVVHTDNEGMLHYSFWDRRLNKWFSTNIQKGAMYCDLTLDSKDRPHVSFPAGTGVIHAYWDGNTWQSQFANVRARVINYYTSIALDPQDNPAISFYEEVGAGDNILRLRTVVWDGSRWDLRTVDADHGSGKFNSMATNSKGYPEIAYGNVEYGNQNVSLRYARWDGKAWNAEILERDGSSKWSVCMTLGKNDVPHIVYTDPGKRVVKYATKRAGKWVFQVVDTIAREAYPDRNGIALDGNGVPYVSYYDAGAGILKVAHPENGRWVAEIIDQGYSGLQSSIQIGDDTIWITYADESGLQLRYANRPIGQPASAATAAAIRK